MWIRLLVLCLLTGCKGVTTLDTGVGHITSSSHVVSEQGDKITCHLGLQHTFPNDVYVRYDHISLCFSGEPFGPEKFDVYNENISIGKTWTLREKE